MSRPTQARLLELFDYDPTTGDIRRRVAVSGGGAAGTVPGSLDSKGYRRIRIGGVMYPATRLIWLMMTGEWPEGQIDHIDTYGPKADWGDRWENLRIASQVENSRNRRLAKHNSSGHTGVYWIKHARKWRAEICLHGRQTRIGYFADFDDAVKARRTAEAAYFGDFAPRYNESARRRFNRIGGSAVGDTAAQPSEIGEVVSGVGAPSEAVVHAR